MVGELGRVQVVYSGRYAVAKLDEEMVEKLVIMSAKKMDEQTVVLWVDWTGNSMVGY